MSYRRKMEEDLPVEETVIWTCENEGCKGWMRDNFAFEHVPVCRECHSPMVKSVKELPLLVNPNGDLKSIKKGTQI